MAVHDSQTYSTTRTCHPNSILLVNLEGVRDDESLIVEALVQNYGYTVETVDLTNTTFSHINFNEVAAVDLNGCWGWQRQWRFFSEEMFILRICIEQQRRPVPVINPPQMFEWGVSKKYLLELAGKGIEVVQSTFVHVGEKDNFTKILDVLDQNSQHMAVLKQGMGSWSSDMMFITKVHDNEYTITAPKRPKFPSPHVMSVTKEVLEYIFIGFGLQMLETLQQTELLIQDFQNGMEVSAIFIDDRPHFIEKRHSGNLVANEDFDSVSKLLPYPDPSLVALANQVRKALPDPLQNPPYLRVDMMFDGENPPQLLEVQTGATRLYLKESERVNDYARMISDRVMQSQLEDGGAIA